MGGWERGLWAARYFEQALREARFEGRIPPASLTQQTARLNKLIEFLKGARADEAARAANEDKKAKAKAKAKANAEASAAAVLSKKVEPHFDTLEQALEAAHACKKCLMAKALTKGCRTCMGDWFEEIRQRGVRPQHVEYDEEFGF